jgi:hypothetical protein
MGLDQFCRRPDQLGAVSAGLVCSVLHCAARPACAGCRGSRWSDKKATSRGEAMTQGEWMAASVQAHGWRGDGEQWVVVRRRDILARAAARTGGATSSCGGVSLKDWEQFLLLALGSILHRLEIKNQSSSQI